MAFRPAVRKGTKLRLALMGPAGSGKTTLALGVATILGGRVGVIDTEHGRSSLHSDKFAFDLDELEEFSPQRYMRALQEAADKGYSTVIIDSLSHAWAGRGGLLEQHALVTRKRGGGSSFSAWGDITPIHHALIEAMLTWPGHLIVTLRVKTDYVQEKNEETGKTTVRDLGLAPVQRDGMEYEFDLVGRLDLDHTLVLTKTPPGLAALDGAVIRTPGRKFAQQLADWLAGGHQSTPEPSAPTPTVQPATPEVVPETVAPPVTNGHGKEATTAPAMPTNGKELVDRLIDLELRMVKAKWCSPGDLIKEVNMQVRGLSAAWARDLPPGMEDWPVTAIEPAITEAKIYRDRCKAEQGKRQKVTAGKAG